MPVFEYTATDLAEQVTRGTVLADTPAEGRQHLRDRGLCLQSFEPAKETRWYRSLASRRCAREQVAQIARHGSLLLRTGVPVVETLDVLTRNRRGALVTVLKDVRDRVAGGQSLADALARYPRWFDRLFVSAVRVGEVSGHLDEAFNDLSEHLESHERLRGQITGCFTYPIILVGLGIFVVLFLMTRVMPQLIGVLESSGRTLPASTRVLKGMSDFLIAHWLLLIVAVTALAILAGTVYRSEKGRRLWQRFALRVPMAGDLVAKSVVARFAQHMCLLLKTGTPFVEAVGIAKDLTGNRVLADELAQVERSVEAGSDIAPAIGDSRIFPPVVVHLFAVGQDTGELPALLSQLRTGYETEVRLALQKFTAALEPLLIVVLAAAVGFVVFACLMPILEATRGIA